jgi:2-phosphosulfolactate phosphatase
VTALFLGAHRQPDHRVRFDWGPTGAAAVGHGADVAVVVDVLSFTTTLCVAVERGITVLPYRWKDDRAAAYAEELDATLAVGRLEARTLVDGGGSAVSLSPAAMGRVDGVDRVVLPSPNGSSICFGLEEAGASVVGASLRNRTAVAHWLRGQDGTVAVVAAGERWPDGSLRPCAEDLWGAGAVLALLPDDELSPEARLAADAFRAVEATVAEALRDCAGGRELSDAGFAEDVEAAALLDVADVVPVLDDGAFHDSSAT